MLLVKTILYGGIIMEERNINFDASIRELLLQATLISKSHELKITTSLIAFGAFARMNGTPLNKYLLKNNLKQEDIDKAIKKLFDKYLEKNIKEEAKSYCSMIIYENKYKISFQLYNIIQETNSMKNISKYAKCKTNSLLFEVFTEELTDIYLDFINMSLGGNVILPTLMRRNRLITHQ